MTRIGTLIESGIGRRGSSLPEDCACRLLGVRLLRRRRGDGVEGVCFLFHAARPRAGVE